MKIIKVLPNRLNVVLSVTLLVESSGSRRVTLERQGMWGKTEKGSWALVFEPFPAGLIEKISLSVQERTTDGFT